MDTQTPIIGISGMSAESKSVKAMIARVEETGALALLFASHAKRGAAKDIHKCDALIIMGNDFDIDPELYIHRYPEGTHTAGCIQKQSTGTSEASKARAAYEQEMVQLALELKMPLFAICGGMQTINIMCGGTLHAYSRAHWP